MTSATTPGPAGLSDRATLIIEHLCRTIAVCAAKNHALGPLVLLLWPRLRRMDARLQALMARIRAGLLSPATPPVSRRPAASRPRAAASPHRFPQGFAWLVRLMPEAAVYGSQLQHLLTDPGHAGAARRRATPRPHPPPALPHAGDPPRPGPAAAAARHRCTLQHHDFIRRGVTAITATVTTIAFSTARVTPSRAKLPAIRQAALR